MAVFATVALLLVLRAIGTARRRDRVTSDWSPLLIQSSETLADIGGLRRAKKEVRDVLYLHSARIEHTEGLKFRAPCGVLLVGPSGSGKTSLALAMASELGHPTLIVGGTELIGSHIGESAARVRRLFDDLRERSPCTLVIDRIDAVGRMRDSVGAEEDYEREQALHALTAQMEAIRGDQSIVVIGTTDRADMLDNALCRPGRFDRVIRVEPPGRTERAEILKRALKKVATVPDLMTGLDKWLDHGNPLRFMSYAEICRIPQLAVQAAVRDNRICVVLSDIRTTVSNNMSSSRLMEKLIELENGGGGSWSRGELYDFVYFGGHVTSGSVRWQNDEYIGIETLIQKRIVVARWCIESIHSHGLDVFRRG